MNNEKIGLCHNETHKQHKGNKISLSTFKYKGCWNCPHFQYDTNVYITVKKASKIYNKSQSTIRRWCKNGKLNAELYVKERYQAMNSWNGSNKIWLIKNEVKE